MSYYEICDKVKNQGWRVVRDPEKRMGPYAYKNNEWVSFDDIDTIAQKIELLKKYRLGGAMIWALDLDDFNGQCTDGINYPLLKVVNKRLGRIKKFKPPKLLVTNAKMESRITENDQNVLTSIIIRPQFYFPWHYYYNYYYNPYFPQLQQNLIHKV